jgi:pimeloyl-ACP methyl ester carboxylesterase
MQELGATRIGYGIGSSLGGVITAAAEAARPGLFERIAMLDPPIHATPELLRHFGLPVDQETSPARKSSLVEMTLRRRRVWTSRDEARASWRSKPMFASLRPEAFELYVQHGLGDLPDGSVALKCDPAVEAHIFATAGELDPRDFAPRVQAPALLVRATGGHFRQDFFEALITLFPRGTLQELRAGHLLPMEAPELTIRTLLAFAAGSVEDGSTQWSTSKP